MLGVALATGVTVWAWGSAAGSAVAAVILLVRAWRARRRASRPGRHHAARGARSAPPAAPGSDGQDADGGDTAEEDTDVADLLIVSELDDEVLVVDEYPRYHVHACAALQRFTTEALPVQEARDLGFTPCARCAPDAALAARHRAASAS